MTDKETERIRKQAYDYYSIEIYPVTWQVKREGYIAGATAENERIKKLIYEIQPRDGKHFPEGWSREEIITILFEYRTRST